MNGNLEYVTWDYDQLLKITKDMGFKIFLGNLCQCSITIQQRSAYWYSDVTSCVSVCVRCLPLYTTEKSLNLSFLHLLFRYYSDKIDTESSPDWTVPTLSPSLLKKCSTPFVVLVVLLLFSFQYMPLLFWKAKNCTQNSKCRLMLSRARLPLLTRMQYFA